MNKMAQQSLASTSTTATLNSDEHYHVFLQCAEDVEKAFGSHLYRGLRRSGLRVFWSKEASRVGQNLSPQIKTAYAYVVIFSPKFASSPRCLEELHQRLESGARIIPVFYHVKPSYLQNTRVEEGWVARILRMLSWTNRGKDGVLYAQALHTLKSMRTYDPQVHRKKLLYEPGTIEKWRSALSHAADISGRELQRFNGDEAALLENIVQLVVALIKEPPFAQPAYPVGLNEWVDEFEKTISQEQRSPGEAKVVVIFGEGGTGKSTLAKEFSSRRRLEYGRFSFLGDVRKYPVIDLQKKLVNDLISVKNPKIENIDDGKGELSRLLQGCKALIILDDVDNVEQLDALLLPVKTVLHAESLILVITRNKNILDARLKESSIYEMKGLNAEQSKELLCWFAFHQPHPDADFEEIVGALLKDCTGLPLSVKVLGGLLHGKDLMFWKHQLWKISNVFPVRIHRWTLLHIAFLFLGEDRDTSIYTGDGYDRKRSLVLLNREKKCLIDQEHFIMHHHLRDLYYRYSAD